MIWHSSDTLSVVKELGSDTENGLKSAEVLKRLEIYKKNELHDFDKPDFWRLLLKRVCNYRNIALTALAVIYIIVSLISKDISWTEPFMIVMVLIINCFLATALNYRNISKSDRLRNMHPTYSTVIRDGIEQVIPSSNLVPGDIVILSPGDYIAADGRIVNSYVFICDEFSVTGETVPVEKVPDLILDDITQLVDRVNMVYAGSYVQSGKATVIVTETGDDTAQGRAKSIVKQTENKTTPLYARLKGIEKISLLVCVSSAVLVFLLGIITHLNYYEIGFESTVIRHILLAIAMIFSTIPDGLSSVLNIAVSLSAERLAGRNVTVMNLPAGESIGSVSVICTDKTGVLTTENMDLVKITSGTTVTDLANDPISESDFMLLQLALICSNLNPNEHFERHSNALELGIERAATKITGMNKADIDGIYPRLLEIPFDRERRLMTTVTVINTKPYAVIKGAPETVLARCNDVDGDAVMPVVDSFADDGLKVLAVALKPLTEIPATANSDELENGLVFVGLLGFENPPDSDCAAEIAECKRKGIRPIVITGDYKNTAVHTALALGIIDNADEALDHSYIETLSDKELSNKLLTCSVFTRATSKDKLRILRLLQADGKQVLITCDSTADALAQSEADFSCALGLTASDSVRNAADLIVDDNKFTAITLAIKESNRIFDSVLRSVKYLISCSAVEISTIILGLLIFGESPLTAAGLLFLNLIINILPSVAFSSEVASSTLSLRRHESRELLTLRSAIGITVPALIMVIASLVGFAVGRATSTEMAMTLAFAVLSICRIIQAFTLSHTYTVFKKGTARNLVMPAACLASLIIIFILILTPLGSLISFTKPNGFGWLVIVLSAGISLAVCEGVKFIGKIIKRAN